MEEAMLDSRKLARIRRRVVGSYLSEKGYAVSDKEYFAKVGHQLRYVRFCAAKYGKAFDVHIALHFDFLPPFEFAVWPGAPIPSEMCSELCALQRLVRNNAGGQYYEYAKTEAEAAAMLHDIAVRAAAGLDEVGAICGDGQRLIELIPRRYFGPTSPSLSGCFRPARSRNRTLDVFRACIRIRIDCPAIPQHRCCPPARGQLRVNRAVALTGHDRNSLKADGPAMDLLALAFESALGRDFSARCCGVYRRKGVKEPRAIVRRA